MYESRLIRLAADYEDNHSRYMAILSKSLYANAYYSVHLL